MTATEPFEAKYAKPGTPIPDCIGGDVDDNP